MTTRAFLIFALAGMASGLKAVDQGKAIPVEATAPPQAARSLGPPQRPASRVLDQTGALTAPEVASLTDEFRTAAAASLSLYVIALQSSEGLPEQDAAGELARLWEDAPLTGVLLHLPGRPMSLGLSGPRLAALRPEEATTLTAVALAAGQSSPAVAGQVKAVARHLAERFAGDGTGDSLNPAVNPVGAVWAGSAALPFLQAGGSAAAVLLIAGFLLARHRRAHRPRLFPLTAFRERFSAPHSGGSNAMTSFSPERERR